MTGSLSTIFGERMKVIFNFMRYCPATLWCCLSLSCWGSHPITPRCATLKCGLFWVLKTIKAQKTHEVTLTSLRIAYKNLDRGPAPKKGDIIITNYSIIETRDGRKEFSKVYLLKFVSMSHCFHMAQKTFVYQTFIPFHLPMNWLSFP